MRLGMFALVFALTGCFSYTNADSNGVSAPEVVRLELSDAGTVNIAPALGTSVEYLEGHVVTAGEDAVTLSVDGIRRRGDPSYKLWPGDSVRIAKGDIRTIQIKKADRGKTTITVVAGATAAIAIVVFAARATGLFSGNGGKITPVPAVH